MMKRGILALVVAVGAIVGVATLARSQNSPRVIRVTAERFSFTPSEIKIQLGEEVELRIESEDTDHGFRIVDTPISGVVPKRGRGELRVLFRPDRLGTFPFECHHVCGAGHDFMRGVVVVTAPRGTDAR